MLPCLLRLRRKINDVRWPNQKTTSDHHSIKTSRGWNVIHLTLAKQLNDTKTIRYRINPHVNSVKLAILSWCFSREASGCHQHLQIKVNIESISSFSHQSISITCGLKSQRYITLYRSIKGVFAVTLTLPQKKPAHEKPENDNSLFKL